MDEQEKMQLIEVSLDLASETAGTLWGASQPLEASSAGKGEVLYWTSKK